MWCLLVIGCYVLVIFPLTNKSDDTSEKKSEKKTESKKDSEKITEKKKDENGVTKGAGGRLKYGIGYTN